MNRKILTTAILILLVGLWACNNPQTTSKNNSAQSDPDPLPSWKDGPAKKSIINFVRSSTIEGDNFIPESDRIVVFDNDGTLWSEQPMYFQFLFAIDRIRAMAHQHPEWNEKQPYKAVLENDMEVLKKTGIESLLNLIMSSHAGMTTDEFRNIVRNWIDTTKHPASGKRYKDMVYQPMLEVLTYFRKNQFKTYIVSGGGIDFMRVFSKEVYGIPPDQVIGSRSKLSYEIRDGVPYLFKLPELSHINDGNGKPIGIYNNIGKKPVAAFGNSDGDLPMMLWTDKGNKPRLLVYIHHTDAQREWAYDRNSSIGKLDKGLDEAFKKGWTIVDMKNDWKKIYPYD